MAKYRIRGEQKLEGDIRVKGAKNSALPVLAAVLLSEKPVILHDIPKLIDIDNMVLILSSIGCKIKREGNTLIVDPSSVNSWVIPDKYVKEIRSSIVMLGAVLARMKKALITYPGGCEIGQRPINLHLQGLKKLGVKINDSHGYLECQADRLVGANIHLDYPSVGATENIMLAATKAEGTTVIRNAAKEPEIIDLQNFINSMGGRVAGAGSNTITIEGVESFHGSEYRVLPDRIVAGTYLAAAAITGSEITISNVNFEHIQSMVTKLREAGCSIINFNNSVRIKAPTRLRAIEHTKTYPYPGFPTDMQALLMSMLTVAQGTSIITENIFENRFKHVPEMIRMGANIRTEGKIAVIQGVNRLKGAQVNASDLRGGAALVLAGLNAEGETIVENIHHIDRGYEGLEQKLRSLGADIERL
ncbi:MAG: UDP-N-acetylglucosamine 1-carboxyvinyltransferase [Caldicoprobacterales bacterium]|nr:UDP-N-acetylglucosamine 1-carboxyvinyltransferase [Bacillota bacterium]NLH58356.1 UDP-N-acetylglucosamine 1-carboxyvinyltransferase [Clostridiales bacterium]